MSEKKCFHCGSDVKFIKWSGVKNTIIDHWECTKCNYTMYKEDFTLKVPDHFEGVTYEPSKIIQEMHETFKQRGEVYGDNYKQVGEVMKVLFPDGIILNSVMDFNTYSIFDLITVKLTRFAQSKMKHIDSIHDIAVYCAMLESLIRNYNQKKDEGNNV